MSKSERVNLRLTPEMKEQLQRAADKEHRTLTNFVESLVIKEIEKMTKLEMAQMLVNSPAWDGLRPAEKLAAAYTKEELQDACDMLEEAEQEYLDFKYQK